MRSRRLNLLTLLVPGAIGLLSFTACFFEGNDFEVSIRIKGSGQVTFGGEVCRSDGPQVVCQKFFPDDSSLLFSATPSEGWEVAEKWVDDPVFVEHFCSLEEGDLISELYEHRACLVTFVPVGGLVAAPVEVASATAEIVPDGDMFPIGVYANPPQYPGAGGEVEVSVESGVVTLDVSVRGLPASSEWDVWIDADGITEGDPSTPDNWRLMGPRGLSTDSDGAGRFSVSLPWESGDHVWAVFINDPLPVGLTVVVSHNVAFRVGR